MVKMGNLRIFILLFSLSGIASRASASPKESVMGLFNEVKELSRKEVSREELKMLTLSLAQQTDENELKKQLFSDLPQLTDRQKSELLTLVEKQLAASLVATLKQQNVNTDLPMHERVKDQSIELVFTIKKGEKEQEVTLLFTKNGADYLLKDILAGKKSLLTVYQRQFKRLFKKHSYAEVIERLSSTNLPAH